ncbi:hypothetical protein [Candidatus Nitrotoga sp. AM1P]|uniref:hypothetical protein n=1 Tax=Candidatus Nitrotoga sp. AM1P TaxID=2559597 RepID=UPI0010BC5384|nr:hypothetical protein [Candidatus Nitrotoga sp. AM1P]BBJ23083.1 hypothetical protein W01_10100 [Candidatus Nitrotoga sp. AM1P]
MIILRNPAAAKNIANPDIRSIVEQRYSEICAGEAYDYDLHGYMIVVEPGDSVAALEKKCSCPILHNYFDDACFGDPEFSPSFEALEDHANCYEMVFILNDDGFGISIFIPKTESININLLAMCAQYATPELTQY